MSREAREKLLERVYKQHLKSSGRLPGDKEKRARELNGSTKGAIILIGKIDIDWQEEVISDCMPRAEAPVVVNKSLHPFSRPSWTTQHKRKNRIV